MNNEMPPFGAYDPDVEVALNWLLSFADSTEWRDRLVLVDEKRFAAASGGQVPCQVGYDYQLWPDDDRMGWYIYLALAALNRPLKYEPREGCRIIPIFKHFGRYLDEL